LPYQLGCLYLLGFIRGLFVIVQIDHFKNIIFDLGGVIINLEEERTIKRFAAVSRLSEEALRDQILKFEEYKAYEKGLLSDELFRQIIRERFLINAGDDEIDSCMNAMLLDIPVERLQLLNRISNRFKLFLLSNTNSIHFRKFSEIIGDLTGTHSIDSFFNKAYYSHKVGMRKPDKEIFEKVLSDNQLDPGSTLFIDDNESNIEGGKSLGISVFHLTRPSQLFDLFS